MVTLLTMGAGNVKVLKETLKSFSGVCNEVIYGNMLLFPEDYEILKSYQKEFNLKIVDFPFNFIFKYGFSQLLNALANRATNDMVMYMNTSEVIDEDYGISDLIKNNSDCNAFYFIHRTDPHRWYRIYNRWQLHWSGLIHEQLIGEYNPYHKPVFMMADMEKDLDDPLKSKILNDVKEICYFQQYNTIVEHPERLGETNEGWLRFATNDYDSMKERLLKKGKRYDAFKLGRLDIYMDDVLTNPEFETERFESSLKIEFQGDPMFLGKK